MVRRRRHSPARLVVLLMALALLASSGSAHASGPEVCGREPAIVAGIPSGQICLVNPPTAAEPWQGSPTIQLRVPAESTGVQVIWRNSDMAAYTFYNVGMQLVAQGPPGETSIWQGQIVPYLGTMDTASMPWDGTVVITATASPPPHNGFYDVKATFTDLPVLGLVNGISESVKRQGQRYVATYSATARAPASVRVRMYISASNAEGGFDFPGKRAKGTATVGGGVVQAAAQLSRRYVLKKCKAYRHCSLFAEGFLTVAGLMNGGNLGFTRQLKVK